MTEEDEDTPVFSTQPGLAVELVDPTIIKEISKISAEETNQRWIKNLLDLANKLKLMARNSSDSDLQLFAASILKQAVKQFNIRKDK